MVVSCRNLSCSYSAAKGVGRIFKDEKELALVSRGTQVRMIKIGTIS